jgi:hypothetical protein
VGYIINGFLLIIILGLSNIRSIADYSYNYDVNSVEVGDSIKTREMFNNLHVDGHNINNVFHGCSFFSKTDKDNKLVYYDYIWHAYKVGNEKVSLVFYWILIIIILMFILMVLN